MDKDRISSREGGAHLLRGSSLFEDMDEDNYPVNRTGWDRWTHKCLPFFINLPEEGNSFMYNYHQKVEMPDRDYDGGCGYIWIYTWIYMDIWIDLDTCEYIQTQIQFQVGRQDLKKNEYSHSRNLEDINQYVSRSRKSDQWPMKL